MIRDTFLLAVFLLPTFLFSQSTFGDCATAFRLTDFTETIEFQFSPDNIVDELNAEDCLSSEQQPTWIKFEVATAGNFFFTITPKVENDDIDFLVFKTNSVNDCTTKETIRCMASGESQGTDSSACFGETGLREGETDTLESPGCSPGDNNFLAPIDCEAGDSYLILVNNFSSSGAPFCIQFDGSAILTLTSTSDLVDTPKFNVYPNPVRSVLNITGMDRSEVTITNQQGQLIMEDQIIDDQLDVSSLSNGKYFISTNGFTQSFIKI